MDTGAGFPLDGELLERLSFVRLKDQLGQSAVGPCYRAQHATLGRDVVVKIFAPALAAEMPELAAAWAALARRFSRIEHPNLVAIHDVVGRRGLHAVVTEFVEEELEFPIMERADADVIAADVARGLAAAHVSDLVCWGEAPRVRLDSNGRAKVDVGLSSQMGDAEFAMDTMIYTPPEQIERRDATAAGDVWRLGTLLYSMRTGRQPFPGNHSAVRIRGILQEPLPNLGSAAIARATCKDPATRCTAAEFAAALG